MPKMHHIGRDATDRKYFVAVPHIVLGLCRDAYDFTLWCTIKIVAGETGDCNLSIDDLARLCGCSHGKIVKSRQYLLAVGLLQGEKLVGRAEHGRPAWSLCIPDLWPDNMAWRAEIGLDWRDYIAAIERTRAGTPSPGDDTPSPGDGVTRDASFKLKTKTLIEQEQEALNGKIPRDIWALAQQQLRLQMTRSTYEAWVRDVLLIGYDCADGGAPTLRLQVANAYAQDWLSLRLRPLIARTLAAIVGCDVDFTFEIRGVANGIPSVL